MTIQLDEHTCLIVTYDTAILRKGDVYVEISHEAIQKMFDRQFVIEESIMRQQKEYEEWLEKIHENS